MKAEVNQTGCIGCGVCAATCPEVFRMCDDGLAEAYQPIEAILLSKAQDARDNCPVSVISIED